MVNWESKLHSHHGQERGVLRVGFSFLSFPFFYFLKICEQRKRKRVEKCLRIVWQSGVCGSTSQRNFEFIMAELSIHIPFIIVCAYGLALYKNLPNKLRQLKGIGALGELV